MEKEIYTDEYCKQIAGTIYKQLGGGRFGMMVGAKNLGYVRTDKGVALVFKFMRNKSGFTTLRIVYDEGQDLYNMIFIKSRFSMKTMDCKITEKRFDGIYFDQMTEVFENFTGLYTRLF